jgi:hypothetical protein
MIGIAPNKETPLGLQGHLIKPAASIVERMRALMKAEYRFFPPRSHLINTGIRQYLTRKA